MWQDADTIRRAYVVWNESGPEAVTDQLWAEDAVYREGPGWPNAGVYRGRAAALARTWGAWSNCLGRLRCASTS